MPLAMMEYAGSDFEVLDCNEPFVETLEGLGIDGVAGAENLINDTSRQPARTSRRLVESIGREGFARHDYLIDGQPCVMRARHVASHRGRTTVLVTLQSAAAMGEQRRLERRDQAFEALHAIYEHIDILHLDEGFAEPVYSQASFKLLYDVPDLADAIRQFADNELFPADRARYREFMDVDTMLGRIDASPQGYLVGFFRARDKGGDFAWKLFALTRLDAMSGQVVLCIRDTNWENDLLFQSAYEDGAEGPAPGAEEAAGISDGGLWRALSQDDRLCIFWKDADRRYAGCNRSFLDFFGLASEAAVLGRTDDEMGWLVDPFPSERGELRVLSEGSVVAAAPGQLIARGELRDIVATKRPVYRNGRVVGIVGYFRDAAAPEASGGGLGDAAYTDSVTGLLNYGGLDAATTRYIEAYERTGANFAMLMVDLDDFKHVNEQFGYEFGDKALRAAAEAIRAAAGPDCVIGHLYSDRFVVLKQGAGVGEAERLGAAIVSALAGVSEVDGTPCTLYAHFGLVRYSEVDSLEGLKREGRARVRAARPRSAKQQGRR